MHSALRRAILMKFRGPQTYVTTKEESSQS